MINIYKASAGSGKTFTLAREYLKLVLGRKTEEGNYVLNRHTPNNHRSILAITFTNKATEEMKSRIVHELAVIAGCEKGWTEKSPYEKYLCDTFGCSPEELKAQAVNALRDLLYDFNFFSVSTIDSFFQLILRSFAHEAEVSGNYDVELDDKAVIAMAVDNILQDLNHKSRNKESDYLIKWLSSYMTQLIENGKTFNIFNRSAKIHGELVGYINDISDDTFREHEAEIIEYLSDHSRFEAFRSRISELSRNIRTATKDACQKALKAMEDAPKGVFNSVFVKSLSAWAVMGFNKTLQGTIVKVDEDCGAAYNAKFRNSDQRSAEVDGLISHAAQQCVYSYQNNKLLNILLSNIYQLGFFSSIVGYIDKYRKENSSILLSDTNALLAKIIGTEDAPFLYERVGLWYHNYLIDEFQDTSLSQWQNLRPLIRESLAEDHDNLVIGDEKQCIYRFRNSDPSLLHNLHTEQFINGRAKVSGNSITENTNWRSSSDVIRFNNTLFTAISKKLGYESIYGNVAQQISPKHLDHKGYVRLTIVNRAAAKTPLDYLTEDLKRQLQSGYKPGDIAILVRKWKEGEEVIRHLESVKNSDPDFPPFQIVSDSSYKVSRSPSVSLIISRLRLLGTADETQKGSKKSRKEIATVINDFETVRSKGYSSSDSLTMALANIDMAQPDEENVPSERVNVKEMDLMTLIEKIISEYIPKEKLNKENAFITAFLDLVADFSAKGRNDIRSFLTWWDETGKNASIAGAKDDSAINIFTIHKSKGLEFPCVHIPYGTSSTVNSDIAWFEIDEIPGVRKEIIPPMIPLKVTSAMEGTVFESRYKELTAQRTLDYLNLLYVAFTRAVDELCVCIDPQASFAENMKMAVGISNQEFCDKLSSDNGTEGASPYCPLKFDANDQLIIGSPTTKRKSNNDTVTKESEPKLMPDFCSYANDSLWENTKLDKPNDIDVARERGLILHGLMAYIKTPADIPNAISRLRMSKEDNSLTETDIQEIRYLISQRVNDKRVQKWFMGYKRLLIERPISMADDSVRRPDRVVWTGDGEIHVIDFKSGNQPPEKYRKQVNGYVSILTSLGYKNVSGYVYYLDSGRIVKY